MFVISAFTTHEIIERLVKQLRNIIDVIQVEFYSNEELITQEIALYKISAEILRQSDTVDRIIRQWNARFIEINPTYVVVEKTGTREEIDRMRETLAEEKLLDEFTRSGSVVLHRESVEEKLQGKISDLHTRHECTPIRSGISGCLQTDAAAFPASRQGNGTI